jgi:putative transposase
MVTLPEQYRWSSVRANLGQFEDKLVKPVFVAQARHMKTRAADYRTWFREGITEEELLCIRMHLEQERAGRTQVSSHDRKRPRTPRSCEAQ